MDNQQVFAAIYRSGAWGKRSRFDSGDSSYDPKLVKSTVVPIERFIKTHIQPTTIVDLGCGNFNVGQRLRQLAPTYIGCDVVGEMLAENRARFPSVTFEELDMTTDPLPVGDVAVIRQVLQHLSNAAIAAIVPKLSQYKWVIVSNAEPAGPFTANLDMETGAGVRMVDGKIGSGVVLTAPPFNLPAIEQHALCIVPEKLWQIRVVAYRMF